MSATEEIIQNEDPKLANHLKNSGLNPQSYAWPIQSTLLTNVLPKDDWLRLMDHLIMHNEHPELLFYFTAAFLLSSRNQLFQMTN